MLKLQEGKYYKRRDGCIVGPVTKNIHDKIYPFFAGCFSYTEAGQYLKDFHRNFDLVGEVILTQPFDPCADVMPAWGMLTPDQQQMIKDNGPWQFYSDDGWRNYNHPRWAKGSTYRSKPKPEIKALTTEEKLNAKLSKALEALRNAGITLKEIEEE
jgi:hypothetical protein